MTEATTSPFGDTLVAHVARRESQVVLGLDPDPAALWPPGTERPARDRQGAEDRRDRPEPVPAGEGARAAAVDAVLCHCRSVLDAVAPACVAVKLQLACFERLGGYGWEAMEAVVAHARGLGLLVIADGKRGDIAISAAAYGQALLGSSRTPWGEIEGLGADLATVNPLMGADSLEPLIAIARRRGRGALVLVRTSNPGAADIQDLHLRAGGPVWERLARMVDDLGRDGVGHSGLSDVGAVVGATAPDHLPRARELMPNTTFLLPGVGAQGGRVQDLAAAFAPGRAGGLITASRSIVNAHLTGAATPAVAARAEAERLREAAWALEP